MEQAMSFARRWLVPFFVLVAAIYLVNRNCLIPVRCNRVKTQISMRNELAAKSGGTYRVASLLRQNISEGTACLLKVPADYFLRIEVANSHLFLQQYDEAAEVLEEGLHYERRPEIFIGIGKARIAGGHRAAGIEALLEAGRFLRNEAQLNDLLQDVAEREVVLAQLRREFATEVLH